MKKLLLFVSFNLFIGFTLKAQTTILNDFNKNGEGGAAKVGTVTIPASGYYSITVKGAAGGSRDVENGFIFGATLAGGKGGVFSTEFYLTQGTVLEYTLGAKGLGTYLAIPGVYGGGGGGGGGGGTGIRVQSGSIMAIAGGGGGANHDAYSWFTSARGYDSPGTGSGGGSFEPQNSSYGSGGGGVNGSGKRARWEGVGHGAGFPINVYPGVQAYGGGSGFNAPGGYCAIGLNGLSTGTRGGGGYGGGGAGTITSYLSNDTNTEGGAGGGGGYTGGAPGNNVYASEGGTSYNAGSNVSSFSATNDGPGAITIQQLPAPSLTITDVPCGGYANGEVEAIVQGYGQFQRPFTYKITTVNGTSNPQQGSIFYYIPAGPVSVAVTDNLNQPVITLSGTVGTQPPPNAPTLPVTSNGTTNPSICYNTSASLSASCTGNTVLWYDASSSNYLGNGSTFTTPNITTNTTYKVRCKSTWCQSPLVDITVTPIPLPNPPTDVTVNSGLICSGSSITLSATCTSGAVTWYKQETGGTALGTGNQFTYQPSATSLYYASCELFACTSSRVATSQVTVINSDPTPESSRLYVNRNATGANDGSSWANAFTNLESALNLSCSNDTEIWVAKGIYTPAPANGDRNLSFNVRDNLKVYGGFSGGEVSLSDREYSLIHTSNSTILNGDLNGDDEANFVNNAENSFSVVRMSNVSNTTRLDGFTISGSNNTVALSAGGGISLQNSSPVIANCMINGNNTIYRGGGIANVFGQPTIKNCNFYMNKATAHGGAFYNLSNSGTTETINISNSVFVGNSVVNNSGSILFNYAFLASGTTQNVNLTNCSFSGNTSPNHGIYNLAEVAGSAVNTSLVNCAFFNNGGEKTLFNETAGGVSSTTANHSFFQSSVTNFTGSNNIISDISPYVSTTDLHLHCGSLAANSGTSAGISATDIDENPRPFPNTAVDIGAFELQGIEVSDPLNISLSDTNICSGGLVSMSAECTLSGIPTWYHQNVGGTQIGRRANILQFPTSNTAYFVSCKNGVCESDRFKTPTVFVANPLPTITLNSDFATDSLQIANSTLTATNKIVDPARVIYKAGNSVTLNHGFEAKSGSTFLAQIGGCENDLISNLEAYFPFNGNAYDQSINSNSGTVIGATLTTDRFGNADKAYAFDGINDRINADVGEEMYSPEKTISLWAMVLGSGNANPRLVGIGPNGSSAQYYAMILEGASSSRRLWFFTSDAVSQAYSSTLVQNSSQWNHYTITFKESTAKVYINGTLDSETAVTGVLSNFTSGLLQIGYSGNGLDFFEGKLDEIRIYNRALNDAEVQAIYNAEKP